MPTLTAPSPAIRRRSTIALPKRSDGWSAETRHIVRKAFAIVLDNARPGEVPALCFGDLLLGAADLDFRRDDLSSADVLIALHSAMLFLGIK